MTKTSTPDLPRPFTPQSMPASRPTIVVGLIPGPTGAAALRYAATHSARSGLPLRLVTAFTGDKTTARLAVAAARFALRSTPPNTRNAR